MGVFILTGEFSSVNFVLSTKLEESHSQPEKTMLMRTRTFILCLLALCLSTIRGYASGKGRAAQSKEKTERHGERSKTR